MNKTFILWIKLKYISINGFYTYEQDSNIILNMKNNLPETRTFKEQRLAIMGPVSGGRIAASRSTWSNTRFELLPSVPPPWYPWRITPTLFNHASTLSKPKILIKRFSIPFTAPMSKWSSAGGSKSMTFVRSSPSKRHLAIQFANLFAFFRSPPAAMNWRKCAQRLPSVRVLPLFMRHLPSQYMQANVAPWLWSQH